MIRVSTETVASVAPLKPVSDGGNGGLSGIGRSAAAWSPADG